MQQDDKDKSERLAGHARQIAKTGDRWFLSLATSLSRVGSWMGRGTSALPLRDRAEPLTQQAQHIDIVPATAASSLLHDPPTETNEPSSSRSFRRPAQRGERKLHRAGVQPLLEALRRVVAEHADSGGRGLQSDERFWTLVGALRSLTDPEAALSVTRRDGDESAATSDRAVPTADEALKRGLEAQVIWKRKRNSPRSPSGKDESSCTRSGSSRSSSE